MSSKYWTRDAKHKYVRQMIGGLAVTPELAINNNFDSNIVGYKARPSTILAWDSSGAMLLTVLGSGGGFLADPIPHTNYYKSYKLEVRMKGITYFGGFKFRLAEHEFVLTESITSEYVTYTKTVYSEYLNQAFEMFRSTNATGDLLIDSLSLTEVIN